MIYVIHEVDIDERVKLLYEIAEVADNIIVGDYLFPKPPNLWSFLNEAIEFLAGFHHYKNYKSYIENEGIYGLTKRAGFTILEEIINQPSTSHLAVVSKDCL